MFLLHTCVMKQYFTLRCCKLQASPYTHAFWTLNDRKNAGNRLGTGKAGCFHGRSYGLSMTHFAWRYYHTTCTHTETASSELSCDVAGAHWWQRRWHCKSSRRCCWGVPNHQTPLLSSETDGEGLGHWRSLHCWQQGWKKAEMLPLVGNSTDILHNKPHIWWWTLSQEISSLAIQLTIQTCNESHSQKCTVVMSSTLPINILQLQLT